MTTATQTAAPYEMTMQDRSKLRAGRLSRRAIEMLACLCVGQETVLVELRAAWKAAGASLVAAVSYGPGRPGGRCTDRASCRCYDCF